MKKSMYQVQSDIFVNIYIFDYVSDDDCALLHA